MGEGISFLWCAELHRQRGEIPNFVLAETPRPWKASGLAPARLLLELALGWQVGEAEVGY